MKGFKEIHNYYISNDGYCGGAGDRSDHLPSQMEGTVLNEWKEQKKAYMHSLIIQKQNGKEREKTN